MERFEDYLQSRGKRMTQQRRVIVEQVFSHHEHFDADDLLKELGDGVGEAQNIGRATVYRTLDQLTEAGLLRKMNLEGRSVYEHDYGYPAHDHLHCQRCNKLIEFSSEQFKELCDAVGREHGFRVTGLRLIVQGVCADCLAKQHRPTRPLDLV
ncbi:MAG: transcriptional repressor [Planctomycetota bacterium]|nr:MAG: transcriptional repressor [Planctomycetota bacterium]REJ93190.1 MAG: transcriptional repressor [Planctomycetota bacterium]REK23375.1 MAG: transcriptional repressor [Planctomycetota bacterium]REK47178.1 MAG: transcriptional repressor [Planctomycetota bacterium]